MTRKIGFLQLPIYLCFLVLLVSCDKPSVPPFQPDDESQMTPGDKSDALIARIYFDATLSMQGFVVPDSTHYTRICPYLESVIVSGWKEEKIDFFRFGEQVEPIDRSTYLQAGHADFYEQENIYRETFIQKIIDYEDQRFGDQMETSSTPEQPTEIEVNNIPEEPIEVATPTEEIEERKKEGQLVVIVTDLFQDRGDINLLVAQLKEKYIKNGIEVGLFGMRSQFDGTVYDTGIGQAPLPYQGDRPFYLLVLGRYADITYYFDRLIANGFSEAETVIFSRYLVNRSASFEGASVNWKNLNRKTFIQSQDPRLKQFRIVKNSDPTKISATLEYMQATHAMSFDSEMLKDSIVAKHAPTGQTEESFDAQKCLEVTSQLEKNEGINKINVVFDLAPRLPPSKKTVYLYEVTLSPRVEEYVAPDWCSEWDMGRARDGSKTLNLVNFVRNLSQVTAQEYKPKIAKFYCYIEKR